jgi:hypothetical protein
MKTTRSESRGARDEIVMLAEVVPPNGKKFVYLYRCRKPLETIEVGERKEG